MTATQTMSFEDRVASIIDERGDMVSIDEVGSLVSSLLEATSHDMTNVSLAKEIAELISFIDSAKHELSTMNAKSLSVVDIPNAGDELEAVVKTTEDAASTIMDAADAMSEMAFELEGEQAASLMEWSTKLFEASSFQDLTGQRINKVSTTLTHLEERLCALADAIGDTYIEDVEEDAFDANSGEVVNEDALIHGPQLDGDGNSQADIDALMASFD